MAFTGLTMSFEEQLVAAADPSFAGETRPTVSSWSEDATSVTVFRDGRAPVVTKKGGHRFVVDASGGLVEADGVTGAIDWLEDLHRQLGAEGARKSIGKTITGSTALLFMVMALTGLWIWWPRKLRWSHVRAVLFFRGGLKGKQRDFNWHHVIGVWMSVVFLGISVSGVVISFRWAQDLVERPQGKPKTESFDVAGTHVGFEQLISIGAQAVPNWASITAQWEGKGDAAPEGKVKASAVTVLEQGKTLPFARHGLTVHPFSGAVLLDEQYDTATTGRRARLILRFLHTGQIFGLGGQAVGALAALSVLVLVWTGLALSWRRFFRRRPRQFVPVVPISPSPHRQSTHRPGTSAARRTTPSPAPK